MLLHYVMSPVLLGWTLFPLTALSKKLYRQQETPVNPLLPDYHGSLNGFSLYVIVFGAVFASVLRIVALA
jgi:hypothetical protein